MFVPTEGRLDLGRDVHVTNNDILKHRRAIGDLGVIFSLKMKLLDLIKV